jgi:hypothetical protein
MIRICYRRMLLTINLFFDLQALVLVLHRFLIFPNNIKDTTKIMISVSDGWMFLSKKFYFHFKTDFIIL